MDNRRTSQGSAITKVIRDANGPLRPLEILELASRVVPTLGIATVYRQLRVSNSMCSFEMITFFQREEVSCTR